MYSTYNPAMKKLQKNIQDGQIIENSASYKGIALKSLYYVVLTIAAAVAGYFGLLSLTGTMLTALIIICVVGVFFAMIVGFIAVLVPKATAVCGSLYGLFYGLFIGVLSALVDFVYPGIVFTALAATLGVFLVMSILYATGAVKVGRRFRSFMLMALISILLINAVILISSIFSETILNVFYGNGAWPFILSLFMVVYASLMLLLSLDNISNMVNNGMDKKWEWLGAFSLLTSLIFMFLQILRFLLIVMSRRR